MANAKLCKKLRRAARAAADPTQATKLVKRYRRSVKYPGLAEPVAAFRDTHFWPEGSERKAYQEMKRGTST